jgi:hypothetical protein
MARKTTDTTPEVNPHTAPTDVQVTESDVLTATAQEDAPLAVPEVVAAVEAVDDALVSLKTANVALGALVLNSLQAIKTSLEILKSLQNQADSRVDRVQIQLNVLESQIQGFLVPEQPEE